jgi:recombination protein RecA
MIISQVRENIGVTYGRSLKRTGGKAMDFFVSQVVWLREVEKIKVNDLVAGIKIQAKIDKNKAWKPYREVSFPILFEYGIDDAGSMVDFLIEHKYIKRSGSRYEWNGKKLYYNDLVMELDENRTELIPLVKEIWDKRESDMMKRVSRKPKY